MKKLLGIALMSPFIIGICYATIKQADFSIREFILILLLLIAFLLICAAFVHGLCLLIGEDEDRK